MTYAQTQRQVEKILKGTSEEEIQDLIPKTTPSNYEGTLLKICGVSDPVRRDVLTQRLAKQLKVPVGLLRKAVANLLIIKEERHDGIPGLVDPDPGLRP